MDRRRLPIGVQTFRKIREDDAYYVDKAPFIEHLLRDGTHYFLSRPRRFGKSLFLDTLKELFEGNGELFEGLAIHSRSDWSVRHPVIRLSFGSGHFQSPDGLQLSVAAQLERVEAETGVQSTSPSAPERLGQLVRGLHRRTGRLDMAVRFADRVYVFEFKVVEQAGDGGAMAQLEERRYADKYRSPDVRVHLVGVEFSSASRNVVAFEHAAA